MAPVPSLRLGHEDSPMGFRAHLHLSTSLLMLPWSPKPLFLKRSVLWETSEGPELALPQEENVWHVPKGNRL